MDWGRIKDDMRERENMMDDEKGGKRKENWEILKR